MSLSSARRRKLAVGTWVEGALWGRAGSDMSALSGRAADAGAQARIDHRVEHVHHEIDGDENQGHHQQIGCHNWDIDILPGLDEQKSHPGPLENGFGNDRK